jgi:hypothetical protein
MFRLHWVIIRCYSFKCTNIKLRHSHFTCCIHADLHRSHHSIGVLKSRKLWHWTNYYYIILGMFEHFSIWEQQYTGIRFVVNFVEESVLDILVLFSSARIIQSILPQTPKIRIWKSFVSIVLYNCEKRSIFWPKESFWKCFKTVCLREYSRPAVTRTHVNSISQESELIYTHKIDTSKSYKFNLIILLKYVLLPGATRFSEK